VVVWLLATLHLRQVWPNWQVFGWWLTLDKILLGSTCHILKKCHKILFVMASVASNFLATFLVWFP
jgi:hypothetical protein